MNAHSAESVDAHTITHAYEAALRELQLIDRNDPLTEFVATRIIEAARTGERNPARLCELIIHELKG